MRASRHKDTEEGDKIKRDWESFRHVRHDERSRFNRDRRERKNLAKEGDAHIARVGGPAG